MANAHNHDHRYERAHGALESPRHRLGAFVRSLFAAHHHDPIERSDSALETSARGIRALKISLVALAATGMLQLVVVLFSGSVALLGDTLHNFADALTALPLWLAFALGRRPPNRRYMTPRRRLGSTSCCAGCPWWPTTTGCWSSPHRCSTACTST